jgi:hypothetical protein
MSGENRSSTFLLSCAPNTAQSLLGGLPDTDSEVPAVPEWTHSLEDSPRAARTESVLAGHRIQIAFFL